MPAFIRREMAGLKMPVRKLGMRMFPMGLPMGSGLYLYGEGVTPYGGGITPYGAASGLGVTPYGGGITPFGGCSASARPLRRMGGAGITDLIKKGVKKLKGLFTAENAKKVGEVLLPAAERVLKGESVSSVARDTAASLASSAAKKGSTYVQGKAPQLSGLVEAAQPLIEKGIKGIKGGRRPRGGNSALDLHGSKGPLNKGQLSYLAQLKRDQPHKAPPAFDRHEVNLYADIIQGKQILSGMRGSGMMRK